MEDELYNQIFLKPRFQINFDKNADVLLSEINEKAKSDSVYKINLIDNHIMIDVPEKESHFWSPQLQLEIENISKNKSVIKGLFGPKPQVWTLFMFIHFAVAIAFLTFAIIGYSNWSLKKEILLPIVMLIALFLVWVILYFIGSLGKSMGQKQMDELKKFTQKLLKEIKTSR